MRPFMELSLFVMILQASAACSPATTAGAKEGLPVTFSMPILSPHFSKRSSTVCSRGNWIAICPNHPAMAPCTSGIKSSAHALANSTRTGIESRASTATSQPLRMRAALSDRSACGTDTIVMAGLIFRTLSAAAAVFSCPRVSSVHNIWRLRLCSSKWSGSTATMVPTPSRASHSITCPPSPPHPITTTLDLNRAYCCSMERVFLLR